MIRAARLTITLAILAWLPALLEQFELPKAAIVRIGGGALLAAAIVVALWPRRPQAAAPDARRAAWQPLDVAMAAWLLVEALATWTSVSPTLSLFGDRDQSEGLLTSLGLAGIYAGARFGTRSAADARRTLLWILGAAAIAVLVALWQLAVFTPEEWANALLYEGWHRPFGSLGHANLLGAVGAMALAAVVGLAASRTLGWAGWAPAVGVFAVGTVATLSRAAWLAMGIGSLASVVTAGLAGVAAPADAKRRAPATRRRWNGWAIGGGIAAVILVFASIPPLRARALELVAGGSGSGRSRLEIWRTALGMWREHPWLGAGPDTFHLLFDRFQTPEYWLYEWGTSAFHAHSIYLTTLATRGLLGILAAAAVLAATALAIRRAAANAAARALLPAWVGVLVAAAVAGGFGALGLGGAAIVAGTLGSLAGLAGPSAIERKRPTRAPAPSAVPLVAGGLAGLLLLWPTLQQLEGSHLAYVSTDDDTNPLAVTAALEAGRWAPWSDVLAASAADVLRRHASRTPDPARTFAVAESCAARAVALAPDRLYDRSELALILLERARLGVADADRRAVAAIERCTEIGRYNVYPRIHFAEMAWRVGRADLALPAARSAAALYPREALATAVLGDVYLALGDRVSARAAMERALTLEWRGDDARRATTQQRLQAIAPVVLGRQPR